MIQRHEEMHLILSYAGDLGFKTLVGHNSCPNNNMSQLPLRHPQGVGSPLYKAPAAIRVKSIAQGQYDIIFLFLFYL